MTNTDSAVDRQPAEDVLRFWFPDLSGADHPRLVSQFQWWFGGGADAAIVERFVPLLERAARGEIDRWAGEPRREARAHHRPGPVFPLGLQEHAAGIRAGSPKRLRSRSKDSQTVTTRLSKRLGRRRSFCFPSGIPRNCRTSNARLCSPNRSQQKRHHNGGRSWSIRPRSHAGIGTLSRASDATRIAMPSSGERRHPRNWLISRAGISCTCERRSRTSALQPV